MVLARQARQNGLNSGFVAPSLQSMHLAHLVHTFHQSVEINEYFKQTLQHFVQTLSLKA
jgi:hypothetical protein